MKATKIIYWITTVVLAIMMGFAAYGYLTKPEMQQGFQHLGFPDYFRVELAIAKIAGLVVLVLPLGRSIKEWAYAGFGITFISAFIAHTSVGDPVKARCMPLIALVLLIASYVTWNKAGPMVNMNNNR